jgi:Calcium/calmodulin dependent protein kinase II Association.
MKNTLFISLLCCISFGFIDNAAGQNQQNLRIERQIDSIFHVMIKAGENLDYDKLSTGVDDRYKAGFITGGLYYAQYDSLIKSVKAKSLGITGQNITIQKEKITVLSDHIVLVTAHGIAKVDVNNGSSFSVNFDWSFVYAKLDNNWKVIQSHQSTAR